MLNIRNVFSLMTSVLYRFFKLYSYNFVMETMSVRTVQKAGVPVCPIIGALQGSILNY